MMISSKPSIGDIWLAWGEFADHPNVGKVRPVVVIDVQNDTCTVVAAKVTSKNLEVDSSGKCIPILDWATYGLRRPSYIRLDQKLELSFEKLLRDAPIGRLSRIYLDVISDALNNL